MRWPAGVPQRLLLALAFVSIPVGLAAEDGRVLIVLDGSNSMWGRVDGTEKIVVAREVLAGMLADLPPGTAVGLAAYGHRRETDCDDIEVLLPVGTHPRAALDAAIRRVQSRGMTPITAALQRVVEQLDRAAGPTHVVLVSDGKETCDGDPCALVRALRARDAALTVHVVGFDVTREEAEQLACIAEAGGGLYAGASTAADLTRALGAIRESVVEAAAPPENRAGAPPAGRDAEEPYWRVETGKATYEGHYSVVHRLGEGCPSSSSMTTR
jgi:Ca-activated chloride channel homolog